MDRIGVRELRQNASKYLARVGCGETIEITDRGRAVALLVPVPEDPWQKLVASGAVILPEDAVEPGDEEPMDFGIDASGTLQKMRDVER
jgi:prevent-host-death family protein